MKTLKVIGNCCLVFLSIIAVCISIAYVYYHFFVKDITIGVNNIGDQIAIDIVKDEELSEEERNEMEERYFLTANFYDNSKENGIILQELRFDYFMSYRLTQADYRSTGMQFVGAEYVHQVVEVSSEEEAGRYMFDNFYYYDTTNGISWSGYTGNGSIATKLNRDEVFIIKIDNRPFAIQLTGQYDIYGPLWGFLWNVKQGTYYYSYPEVFECVMKAIKSNSMSYGDYYITVDLSDFFSIREFDPETGKYKADDVTDIIKNYSVLKFHYDENGARNSTQSIFGCIECNSKYDTVNDHYDTTYWQERLVYNLDLKNCKLRYSDTYDGYFVSLSMDMKELFRNMPRAKVNITIDMLYGGSKIVGLDYNAFEGVELDTLTINGTGTFYMLDKAMYDTDLKTLKMSGTVNLIAAENAFNNEYEEVSV